MTDAGSNYPIDRDSSPTLARIKMIKVTELNALAYKLTAHQRTQLWQSFRNRDLSQFTNHELDNAILLCERTLYHNRTGKGSTNVQGTEGPQ